MRRTSCHHLPQLEGRVETFLLQLLDLLPDRGLDLVLFDIDRSGGPARYELVYVDDDEPGSVSLREALAYGSACAAALEPSVAQMITLNIATSLPSGCWRERGVAR
jgi:hypothetical protein